MVINSAGQDNHYTDPLATMSFTARGYAKLNEKLAPDLAVLEGGYSIETALPYVNMGIIMAMAGLDYSNLYEPDYNEEYHWEDPRRLKQLEQTIRELNSVLVAAGNWWLPPAKSWVQCIKEAVTFITIQTASRNSSRKL